RRIKIFCNDDRKCPGLFQNGVKINYKIRNSNRIKLKISMNSDRLKHLQKFTEDDPGDPFNWYALALEYLHSEPNEAMNLFNKPPTQFEDYLPTYCTADSRGAKQGTIEAAAEIFRKGIQVAERQKETRTASELRSGLEEILFE